MNTLDKKYQELLQDILDNGVTKSDRTGTGTISVFGRQIRHKMSEGFPLLTTKKMAWKTMVTELLWFLRGDTNIKYLVDNGCHIWDGDAYKFFKNSFPIKKSNPPKDYINEDGKLLTQEEFINKIKTDDEFAKRWGELGPIYGKQWRSWTVPRMDPKGFNFDTAWEKSQELWKSSNGMECGPSFETFCMSLLRSKIMGITYGYHTQIDQITSLINDLKTNPDSRRLMVNAWNVGELDQMVLPPCHYGFQVYTRELSDVERYTIARQYGLCPKYSNIGIENCTEEEHYNKYNVPTRAISLMWNQRSVDTFLGLPFNIASYGLLLEIIAKEVNMVPDELVGNLGDVHLYSNHIEQAKEQIGRDLTEDERYELVTQQMSKLRAITDEDYIKYNIPNRTREPYPLPFLKHMKTYEFYKSLSEDHSLFHHLNPTDFTLENYQSHPIIKAPLSN
jgi:thymidylate synthase